MISMSNTSDSYFLSLLPLASGMLRGHYKSQTAFKINVKNPKLLTGNAIVLVSSAFKYHLPVSCIQSEWTL